MQTIRTAPKKVFVALKEAFTNSLNIQNLPLTVS